MIKTAQTIIENKQSTATTARKQNMKMQKCFKTKLLNQLRSVVNHHNSEKDCSTVNKASHLQYLNNYWFTDN